MLRAARSVRHWLLFVLLAHVVCGVPGGTGAETGARTLPRLAALVAAAVWAIRSSVASRRLTVS